MTNVEFFFDPSCPWTWVTSRWLAAVAPERQLQVTWRPWSLPIKNKGQELPADLPDIWRTKIEAGRAFAVPALRVLEAAGAGDDDQARGRLYTELGRRFHAPGNDGGPSPDPDEVIVAALAAARLPAELTKAADEEAWDARIRDTMEEVRQEVGDDVGVPIVAIREGSSLRAMAGPIMAEMLPQERALALWDAVATITAEPTVFELKRQRTAKVKPPALEATGSGTGVGVGVGVGGAA
jgi:2-hydroxychromene-2-carboxylate isomerase